MLVEDIGPNNSKTEGIQHRTDGMYIIVIMYVLVTVLISLNLFSCSLDFSLDVRGHPLYVQPLTVSLSC